MKNKFLKFSAIAPAVAIMAFALTCKSKKEPVPDVPAQEDPVQFVTPEHREFTFTGDGVTAYTKVGVSFTPTFAVAADAPAWDVVSKPEQSWLIVTKTDNTFTLSVAAHAGDGQLGPATVTVTAPPEQPVVITVGKDAVFEYSGYMPAGSWQAGGIVDMALFSNGDGRPAWTQENFKPYLTWTNPDTQKEEWLFDGFQFNEGECINYGFSYNAAKPATKVNSLHYLDFLTFDRDISIGALDKAVGATIQRLGDPPRPRRVVIMLYDPPPPQVNEASVNWGELNGKPLDFNNTEDRIAAVKWWVDEVIARWDRGAYKNLEFAGFYWHRENVYYWAYDYELDKKFIQECIQYIHGLGKRVFWIPYWEAKGNEEWKQIGFDVAFQQPNHQFDITVPDSRVAEACNFAESRGMGMELEFQKELLIDPVTYAPRLWVYLNTFEQSGVWQNAAVAYYMGANLPNPNIHAYILLSQSTDPILVAIYHKMCSIIAERQKRFAVSQNGTINHH